MVSKLILFFEESRVELKKVNWPSRAETVKFTVFVIALSLMTAAFSGFLDFAFLRVLGILVR